MRRSRAVPIIALGLATGLVVGLDAAGTVQGPLDRWIRGDDAQQRELLLEPPVAADPQPVLGPVSSAPPPPNGQALARLVDPLLAQPALGDQVSLIVRDAATGAVVLDREGSRAGVPASASKIVTATAVLSALGPQQTLSTRVVSGAAPGSIVLVGGGDPSLRSSDAVDSKGASLEQLSARTADALRASGSRSVTLAYDDSLFTGPAESPRWPDSYIDSSVVAPVSALSIDGGRANPESPARVRNPAAFTAQTFARQLVAEGITVKGTPRAATAASDAEVVAEVRSPSLATLTAQMLTTSDNDAAEALWRWTAIARDQPATFEGGGEAALGVLRELGVPLEGLNVVDGSGLSRDNRASPQTLAAVLATSASSEHPELRAVITGLPVARWSGTLAERFDGRLTRAGAGLVRAKTGTLTGVTSLAGTLVDGQGRLLEFSLVADAVPAGLGSAAQAASDRLVTAIATCRC